MNLSEYYQFRILEHKFPDMLPEDRYWGGGMGVTPECLDAGRADAPLAELELERTDVEIVPDQEMINKVCRQYLIDTDWYATRYAETGVDIPEEISTLRTQARLLII